MRRIRPSLLSYVAPMALALVWPAPAHAIINGQVDSGDPSVAALEIYAPGGGGLCTCTIVSPHVALTAAHCVDPDSVGANPSFTVIFNTDSGNLSEYIDGVEAHFDPQFNLGDLAGGHDIAIVKLQTDATVAPYGLTPIPPNRAALSPLLMGMPLRAIGYGATTETSTGAGIKHYLDTSLGNFTSKSISIGYTGFSICHGDSGGPDLMTVNGQQAIVGVHSYVTGNGCVSSGTSTRVDVYTSGFVDPWIAVIDPGSVPDHCKADGVCQWASCPAPDPDCATYSHCGMDNICEYSGCAPPDTDCWAVVNAGAAAYGSSCQQDADCTQGSCQHGLCTQPCDPQDANTCPSGYTCQTVSAGSFCFVPGALGGGGGGGGSGGGGAGGCSAVMGGVPPARDAAFGGAGLALGLALALLIARRHGGGRARSPLKTQEPSIYRQP